MRKRRLWIVLVPAAAVVLGLTLASPAAGDGSQRVLDRVLAGEFARSPLAPGISARVDAPGLHWAGAVGVADRVAATPLRATDTFRIASVTKTFTAATVLSLVDRGRVRLDAPIASYLPAPYPQILRDGGYDPDAITVRHLLTHTNGLYDYGQDPAYQQAVLANPRHRWTPVEQVRWAMTHGHPLAAPGAEFHYSDTGYVLLARIVEAVTGQRQAVAYRRLLNYRRLGLTATWFETLEPAPRSAPPRAHQYYENPAAGLDIDTYGADPSFDLYGGGGLVSSTADLNRFYRALLSGEIISPRSLRTMLDHDASMGIFAETVDGMRCWEHEGFWGSLAMYCPDRKLAVSVTLNVNAPEQSMPSPDDDAVAFVRAATKMMR